MISARPMPQCLKTLATVGVEKLDNIPPREGEATERAASEGGVTRWVLGGFSLGGGWWRSMEVEGEMKASSTV